MSDKKFLILGREIRKGESAILDMDVAKLHTRNSLRIPVIVERSVNDGPVLLLMGGVHGDESNGVAIVRDIIHKKLNKPQRGTIICIPVFNVFGYLIQSREFPDGRDLNRMFPGSDSGSLASQFAYKFTKEIAPIVDYIIDFHAGGALRYNFPNIRCVLRDENSLELAKVFGAPFIVNSEYIPKSIRSTVSKMGKKIILYEGGKSHEIDQTVVKFGVEGALNIMRHLNMQNGEAKNQNESIIIAKSKWLRASYSGMFESYTENGSFVKRKTLMGRISDPYGEFEKKVYAPFDCYVYGLNTAPIVNKGDAIFHVSVDKVKE